MERLVRRLRRLANAAFGNALHIEPDIMCAKERFGSDCGGWDVVTTGIDSNSVVYSFGVGEDASFDASLIERFNPTIHAFDPTPKSIAWVKSQDLSPRFVMHEYGIAAFDGDAYFSPPKNPSHVSHTILDRPSTKARAILVPVKRLSTIMMELGHERIDILKMDVEGAEYDVIDDMDKSGIRPRQLLIELHHRFPGVGVKRSREAIHRIRSMGYQTFSASGTNEDFCFIRKPG